MANANFRAFGRRLCVECDERERVVSYNAAILQVYESVEALDACEPSYERVFDSMDELLDNLNSAARYAGYVDYGEYEGQMMVEGYMTECENERLEGAVVYVDISYTTRLVVCEDWMS